jgi:hypothetical protein
MHHFLKKDIDKIDRYRWDKKQYLHQKLVFESPVCQYWNNVCYGDENRRSLFVLLVCNVAPQFFSMVLNGFKFLIIPKFI